MFERAYDRVVEAIDRKRSETPNERWSSIAAEF
jgi:hypothetical protein